MEAKGLTANWNDLSPGDKQAWLLDQALGGKREILPCRCPMTATTASRQPGYAR